MIIQEVFDAGEEVMACVTSIDTVVTVGIDILIEILVCLYKCLSIFRRVTVVDVIVGYSVTKEQCTM